MRPRILGIIGKALMFAALAAGAAEVYQALDRGSYHVLSASDLLLGVSPRSLAFLARNLPSLIWLDLLEPLLRLPLWLVLGAPGMLLESIRNAQHSERNRSPV